MFTFKFRSPKKKTIVSNNIQSALRRYYMKTGAQHAVVTKNMKQEYIYSIHPKDKNDKRVIKVKCIGKNNVVKKEQAGGSSLVDTKIINFPAFRLLITKPMESELKIQRDEIEKVLKRIYGADHLFITMFGSRLEKDATGNKIETPHNAFIEYVVFGKNRKSLKKVTNYGLIKLLFRNINIDVVGVLDDDNGFKYEGVNLLKILQGRNIDQKTIIEYMKRIDRFTEEDFLKNAVETNLITAKDYDLILELEPTIVSQHGTE
jgi:hypothetical protein